MPKQVRQIGAQTREKKNLKRKNHWKRNKSDVIKDKARRKAEDPLSAIKVEKKVKKWNLNELNNTENETTLKFKHHLVLSLENSYSSFSAISQVLEHILIEDINWKID